VRSRDAKAAQLFCRRTLKAKISRAPRVINVDKHAAYPKAFDELKANGTLPKTTKLRQCKYFNNMIEHDLRNISAID
jgi:transposase-like protein